MPIDRQQSCAASLWSALLFWVVTVVIVVLASAVAKRWSALPELVVIGAAASVATLALTAVFARFDGMHWRNLGLRPERRSLVRVALGVIIGIGLVSLHTAIVIAMGHVAWQWTTPTGAQGNVVVTALVGYLALACREELAFRGYLLLRLLPAFGAWPALLIMSTLFALEHALGGDAWSSAIFGAGVGALVFGMAALATRGVALPIGLHAAWNCADWARGGKGAGGMWTPVVEHGHEAAVATTGIVAYVAIMLLAVFAFSLWRRCRQDESTRQA